MRALLVIEYHIISNIFLQVRSDRFAENRIAVENQIEALLFELLLIFCNKLNPQSHVILPGLDQPRFLLNGNGLWHLGRPRKGSACLLPKQRKVAPPNNII